jgi:GTP-binding protein
VLSADFVAEAREVGGLPAAGPPEIAIAGRSNVGKSTLLNCLAARRALARTSKTPGRTRGVILYDLVLQPSAGGGRMPLRFVDLPGYGYAKVGRDERHGWGELVEGFVKQSDRLKLFLVLVDARRGVEDEERQLIEWLASEGVAWRVVATKLDKLTTAERGAVRPKMAAALGTEGPPPLPVSAETGDGIERLWAVIMKALEEDAAQGG